MAFEDVYGEVASASYALGTYDSVNEDYLLPLLDLFPPGPIWKFEDGSDMRELVRALSYALVRVEERGLDLAKEMDPRTSVELLSDWETLLDLPGDNPSPPTTLAGRRLAVHAKLLGYGDPTPAYYESVAAGLGYTATVVHKEYDPFVAGSLAGDPLTQSQWRFVWSLVTLGADPDADSALKWSLRQLVLAHTRLVFKIAYATWDARTSGFGTSTIRSVHHGNSIMIAVGDSGKLTTSTDGITWTARTSQFGTSRINKVTSAASVLVALGELGKLSTSTDGITWTARTSQFGTHEINVIVYKNTLFVIAGTDGDISTSPDGYTWTARTPAGGYVGAFRDAVYGRGLYVLGGTAGEIQTSPDGVTWTARTSQFGTTDVNALAYGNGTLVAGGDLGTLSTSTNGTSWTSRTSGFGTTDIDGILYSQSLGMFVAYGKLGKLATSPDGITWTLRTSQISASIVTATQGAGLLVIAGGLGQLAVSTDGVNWTARDSSFGSDSILTSAYAPGVFFCGGFSAKLSTTPYGEL